MSAPPRRLLIVTPHFPPINAPDMQRARMSLPYYRAAGWEPVVLCVDERFQDGVREPELLETIPSDIRIVRCRALSLPWTRRLGLRNLGLRSWPYLLTAGTRLLRRERFDLVLISNTQFITFTLGRLWRSWFGVPYVLDVQDPWRTDYYERPGSRPPPGGWKYQPARAVAWALEGWSFARASGILSVSPRYVDDLRSRYPKLAGTAADVIPFGTTEVDSAIARRLPAANRFCRDGREFHVVYTGASGPIMPHALTVLFEAVRRYRALDPRNANRLRFHFLGTSYAAEGSGTPTVRPLAERCGVADLVTEVPHRLGHLECLRLQQEADALFLGGSSDLAYSPSKLYPYVLSGRPILGLVFRGSELERLLNELACAGVVSFAENDSRDETHARVIEFFTSMLAPDGAAGPRPIPPRLRDEFLADSLVRRQARLFERARTEAPS